MENSSFHPHNPYGFSWEAWLQKWFYWLLVPAILVNAGGLFITILEPDGALYATIAKTIAQTGDFINLRVDGKDWLDKPHFPFWMAALSFRVFGINSFAYKFPALLFWAAGGWYTYRFAYSLYGKSVAQLAALIYVSAAHLVISNNDVRAEPYLTGLVIGSVFHFYKASRLSAGKGASRRLAPFRQASYDGPSVMGFAMGPGLHLLAGSLLAACAVMTKGPFVLITITAGFILDWILSKDWQQFWNSRWWIALVLTGLFITPELYCLYIQFDLHPEKWVFGRTGVSGIRFFFWDSQFGRFFNTGPIKGSGDPFFYFHTLLWAFLPWSLLLYAALVQKCRTWGKGRRGAVQGDAISAGAAIVSFIIFSLSRFQLPHYLNMVFPFFAVLTAGYIYNLHKRTAQRIAGITQNCVALILAALLPFLSWFFHPANWLFILIILLVLSVAPFLLFRGKDLTVATGRSFWMALLTYGFINFCFYPALLRYQAGTEAGQYINDQVLSRPESRQANGPPARHAYEGGAPVYMLQEGPVNYSFEFYCRAPVQRISPDSLPAALKDGEALLFLPSSFSGTLIQKGYKVQELKRFPNFHISQLTGEFLHYTTRQTTLEDYSVVRVSHPHLLLNLRTYESTNEIRLSLVDSLRQIKRHYGSKYKIYINTKGNVNFVMVRSIRPLKKQKLTDE